MGSGAPPPRRGSGPALRRPLRVLYVEDNVGLRKAIIRNLTCFAWNEASNLAEAWKCLATAATDRLLIDIQLGSAGNTDGLSLLRAARANGLLAPAIILSAHLDFGRVLYALQHYALAFPKDGLRVDVLRELIKEPFANATLDESMPLDELARHVRGCGGSLSKTLREVRTLAIKQELAANAGNVSATSRITGYARVHIGRFKKAGP